jgi:hypothetical protein
MMAVAEVREWLETLAGDSGVAVDEGGLMLVEVNAQGEQIDNYLEVGSVPEDDEEEDGA